MLLSELDFELPAELIAQCPSPDREAARLMIVDRASGHWTHTGVRALPELLPAPALLVVNDTRVFRARLRGRKPTGGAAELLLVRHTSEGRWCAMGRAGSPLRPATRLRVGPELEAVIEGRAEDGLLRVRLENGEGHEMSLEDEMRAIERHGEVPLPPYIRRAPAAADDERYQTVYARHAGAVAAPTAGLHLTAGALERARARGIDVRSITLHVGPGTFAPVTTEQLDDHVMHPEHYTIDADTAGAIDRARAAGTPVVAVGTTVVRTLESAVGEDGRLRPGAAETRLLLQPGSAFRIVDRLLTNFHVPRSTLMALVMAFAGPELIRQAYREAVRMRYRFYSYGDAMLIQ